MAGPCAPCPSRAMTRNRSRAGLFSGHRSVSCLGAWEAKIKAEKKPRRRQSQSRSRNPRNVARSSRLSRRSRPPSERPGSGHPARTAARTATWTAGVRNGAHGCAPADGGVNIAANDWPTPSFASLRVLARELLNRLRGADLRGGCRVEAAVVRNLLEAKVRMQKERGAHVTGAFSQVR
jgi:hypothetical protein